MNEFYNKMNYFENIEKIPAKIYYHYTSLDALYNIVTSKTFRLTSLKSSNDKRELYYKPEQFLVDLLNLCDSEQNENIKKYLQLINTSVEQNKEKFFLECAKKRFPYALCMSEKKDNLTHWDRYALGCTGVCIGFNVSALDIYLRRMEAMKFGKGLYDIGKIFYSWEQRVDYIRNELLQYADLLFRSEGEEYEWMHGFLLKNGYVYAISTWVQLAKFVKNSSFIDEDEIRLYHDAASIKEIICIIDLVMENIKGEQQEDFKKNFIGMVEKLKIKEEEFCMTKSGIRGYKNLCLEDIWGSGMIPEIILGPMCIQNRNELIRFLKANGLEGTKVLISKVPIRL